MKKSLLLISMMSTSVFAGGCPTYQPTLIFSEYMEGSSNNKAIEIYNGTGVPVDLSTISILRYNNGSPTPSSTSSLAGLGSLADNDVFVIANSSGVVSNTGIIPDAQVDDTTLSTVTWYNGDDALELLDGASLIDSIGQVGFDPGSEWNVGGVGTQNETLRRKITQCGGDTDSSDVFDPSLQWDTFAEDTFDNIGFNSGLLPVELMNFSVE